MAKVKPWHKRNDTWTLSFLGGSLAGQVKQYPYLPQGDFGYRSDGAQEFYELQEYDEESRRAVFLLRA